MILGRNNLLPISLLMMEMVTTVVVTVVTVMAMTVTLTVLPVTVTTVKVTPVTVTTESVTTVKATALKVTLVMVTTEEVTTVTVTTVVVTAVAVTTVTVMTGTLEMKMVTSSLSHQRLKLVSTSTSTTSSARSPSCTRAKSPALGGGKVMVKRRIFMQVLDWSGPSAFEPLESWPKAGWAGQWSALKIPLDGCECHCVQWHNVHIWSLDLGAL